MENGRLLRLLAKLQFVKERQVLGDDTECARPRAHSLCMRCSMRPHSRRLPRLPATLCKWRTEADSLSAA
eukprot:6074509-Pleurochrysis_carterae.AAC.1